MGTEKHAYPRPPAVRVRDCAHELFCGGIKAPICIGLVCENRWPRRAGGEGDRGRVRRDFLFMISSADELDAERIMVGRRVSERLGEIFGCP
jgi:hypothetical protein